MNIVVADLETFWSTTHSLSKMPAIAYVMHPDTEVISCSFKVNNQPTEVYFGHEVGTALRAIDWGNTFLIGHNMSGFDAMIFAWRYGINPKIWGCTAQMARLLGYAKTTGVSLKALSEHFGIGIKDNTALVATKGKHLKDFTEEELRAMEVYNREDTELCFKLFKRFVPTISKRELKLMDMTTRMLTEPQFAVDQALLQSTLQDERERKHLMLLDVATMIGAYENGQTDEETAEAARKVLASAGKFSEILRACNVPVPMKPSPTNPDKETPALAKTDEAFIALQNHKDPMVAAATQARLGVKSTLLETRLEAFISAADSCDGRLPVPLRYYGADTTGRWSGEQYNPQNLPRIGKKPKPSDALRLSLKAPKGSKVVVADLSGIELRVNHFLWQVPSSMALFKADPEKADLYVDFASTLYDVPEAAVNNDQRQIGKVCVAEGTLVLCKHVNKRFWVPIEQVNPKYQLWDGEEWVWAQGVVSNGWKKTQNLCGVWLTPDHLVLCGTMWQEARYVRDEKVAQALATGAENLSLLDMLQATKAGSLRLSLSATAGFLSTRLRLTISKHLGQLGVTFALKKPRVGSGIGSTLTRCQKMHIVQGCLTGYLQRLLGAITLMTRRTQTTAQEALRYVMSGAKIEPASCGMYALYPDGTSRSTKWIESMSTKVTVSATSDSFRAGKTCSTNDESKILKQEFGNWRNVYDILNCGPRNRFTVLTNRGPMVVHNCHLGLGFGAGPAAFKKVAKLMGGVDLSDEESADVVRLWRATYSEIPAGWKTCHAALGTIYTEGQEAIDPWKLCWAVKGGIATPQGFIHYPDLRLETTGGKQEWVYGTGRNKARIYAGKVTENIVQHLAREIIADNALDVKQLTGYYPALMVHDELVYVVPDSDADNLMSVVHKVMRTPPKWWPELVTWSAGGIANSYGETK